MSSATSIKWPGQSPWPAWARIIFPFLFVYFLLFIEPWGLLGAIPGAGYVLQFYFNGKEWLVNYANDHFFHSYKLLIPPNGSGDTSYSWTEIKINLILSVLIGLIWLQISWKLPDHNKAAYWLKLMLRYTLIINCLGYGFAKVFLNQMSFPSLSNLSTPLGDLLPMRLSWLFIGYSGNYQFFLGLVECIAGILLLFRKTATLGALFAAGIFANVAIMNLSYDIPVKIFSIHLFSMALFLLAFEYKRLADIFLYNRPAPANHIYDVSFPKKWMRIAVNLVKYGYVLFVLYRNVSGGYESYKRNLTRVEVKPVKSGIYDVSLFVINHDTLPPLINDTVRWKDVVFEYGRGSVNTTDTIFWQRYRRGYFSYTSDTVKQLIHFTRSNWTFRSDSIFSMQYKIPDSTTLVLWGKIRNDSIYAVLTKSQRHFQLAEKQFHWLSEYNR
jgi:hypothetical protein